MLSLLFISSVFFSRATKVFLLARFPTSQAVSFPHVYLRRGRSSYMCPATHPREGMVVSAGDMPWAVQEEAPVKLKQFFCFLTRQTNDRSSCA